MEKDRIYVEADSRDHMLVIDNKRYRLLKQTEKKDGHRSKVIFERVDEKEYKNRVKKVAKYIEKNSGLTVNQVLEDALLNIDINSFEKLEKEIKKKTPPKVKNGCLNIEMGKQSLEVR